MKNQTLSWDSRWLSRFDIQAPRYTSYPTANQFSDQVSADVYAQQIQQSASSIAPLGLYIHVPFCRQNCFYCACNKLVTRDNAKVERYLQALLKEIAMLGRVHSHRRITEMHWGGGTPTYLSRGQITQIMYALAQHFTLDNHSDHDYSIEIDPRTIDVEDLALLRGLGFNRVSMGIQDFDIRVQRLINRVQSADQVEALVNAVRENAFDSLNFDLIYGLPGQTLSGFKETLNTVIALSPDRIACYNYAHLPDKFPGQRGIDSVDLPSATEKLGLLQCAGEMLQAAGYCYLGMDHFAKEDDALAVAAKNHTLKRNFQGYATSRVQDNIAIGPSGISYINQMYSQNETSLNAYCLSLENDRLPISRGHVLTEDDQLRKRIITDLACKLFIRFDDIDKQFGIQFKHYFADEVNRLAEFTTLGLLTINEEGVFIAPQGRLVLRNILLVFDLYHRSANSRKIFSKAI